MVAFMGVRRAEEGGDASKGDDEVDKAEKGGD